MQSVKAPIQAQGVAYRLAVVCLLPDPGHLIPLLKIAAQARQRRDVLVVAPDELVGLASSYGFSVAGVGSVRPESGQLEYQRYIAVSEWVRVTSAFAACQERYFDRLNEKIERSFERHYEHLTDYCPSSVLCDDQWLPRPFLEFLIGLNVPLYLHSTAPNYRRHNTWSLKHCYWSDSRGMIRDAVAKTRNELRLLGKRLSSPRAGLDPAAEIGRLPPIRPSKKAITHISTGTSFLEKALLSHRLLYTGEGRVVFPAIPPLEAPLPHDLRQWLDQCPDGDVVYVSFGTLVRPEVARMVNIARAALACGKRVLLQYPGEFPAIPGVRQEQWVPQATALSHPAISMVISHGGAGSLDEALWNGKPMLCIPSVWDHYYNSWIVSLLGAGIALPRRALRLPRRLAAGVQRAMSQEHADSARAISVLMRNYWSENQEAVKNLFRSSAKTGTAGRP